MKHLLNTILSAVKQTNNKYTNIMLFGHNPFITDFANSLTSNIIENIPTCGVVKIAVTCSMWQDFGDKKSNSLGVLSFP